LEHLGLVQEWQREVKTDAIFAASLAVAHREYAVARWAALSEEDQEYCLQKGYGPVLRDAGVGGYRFYDQIKCLHAHTAHLLAGGNNPIGRRVLAALERGDDAAAGT
jgi:hypothetical protein